MSGDKESAQRFQFGVRHLLWTTLAVGISLALLRLPEITLAEFHVVPADVGAFMLAGIIVTVCGRLALREEFRGQRSGWTLIVVLLGIFAWLWLSSYFASLKWWTSS